MEEHPFLTTPRLMLSQLSDYHAREMHRLLQYPEVTAMLVTIPHTPAYPEILEMIRQRQERFQRHGDLVFAIMRETDLRFIGSVTLECYHRHNVAELRYWLGGGFWNQGYATEAAREVVRYAFADSDLALAKIKARHLSRNTASGKVLEKLGMREEGYFRREIKRGDVREDIRVWGILREEFEKS